MKKALLIILGLIVFVFVALVTIPFLFKDRIIERLDREIAAAVNARVYYDLDQISFSVFRRFPHVSATLGQFGVIGNPPFQNDTLIHVNTFQVDINLRSLIFDEFPTLTGIHLNGGSLYVKVLEDGQANYDIMYPSEDTIAKETNFQVDVDLLEVNNLNVIYDDRQLGFFMALADIKLDGSGEFTAAVYDLPVQMSARIVSLSYDDINYLSNKFFRAETTVNVDMEQMRFTFGEGEFALNDFLFDLDGFVAIPGEDIEMDLRVAGKQNTFRSILSLVPGIYTENFGDLKTSGNMSFRGYFKGIYNEQSFPEFAVVLHVQDGMFQYPDLPKPVSNIQFEMEVSNEKGDLAHTKIHIPTFNVDFGSNPLTGRFFLADMINYEMDGMLKGRLNLEELTSIFPIDGMALRGTLDIDAMAKGRYDTLSQIIPQLNADLILRDGFIKSIEYPAPIEKLNVNASVVNTSGKMRDFIVDLRQFGFELEDEVVSGRLKINDFERLNWDGALQGKVNLGKILAIFPIEGIIMEGNIAADLQTKGSYKDVEEQRFSRLDTRGEFTVSDFYFTSNDLPQGIRIRESKAQFAPERISLVSFDSRIGESPVNATGFLSNYLNFFFNENETLQGQLNISSIRFNINQWMTASEPTAENAGLSVIELPGNIDFSMNIAAAEVLYDNLILRDVKGNLILRDGVLTFKDAGMQTLGGSIVINGAYDPRDLTAPKFDFNLSLTNLSIPEAFRSFSTVQAFAPVAQHMTGNFNTSMSFSGLLGQNMMPVLSSLDGKGLLRVAEAAFKDSPIIQGVTSLTRLNEASMMQFRNLNIPFEINNGVMNIRPFDVRLWDYQATIQGSTGFDGSIQYLINMMVPAGRFGAQANNLLSALSNTESNANTLIPLSLNLSGSYNRPQIGLAGGNSMETLLTNALRSRVASERENIQAQATEQFRAAEDSLKRELKLKADVLQDSVKKEAERKVADTKDKAVEEAKTLLRGVIGRTRPVPAARPDTTRKD
jgi:hypothetical protein